jgi:hypothetical protein
MMNSVNGGDAVLIVALSVGLGLAGCSARVSSPSAQTAIRPIASIQELMQSVIDPSADGVWNAVETVTTRAGDEVRVPKTAQEWQEARSGAITLVEGTNLLVMPERVVGHTYFPAEAEGALDSTQIQKTIGDRREAFNGFAVALRAAGLGALAAIDAKDPVALVKAGGALDEICEGCHMTFWYPNQVIPSFPSGKDPARPILRLGSL